MIISRGVKKNLIYTEKVENEDVRQTRVRIYIAVLVVSCVLILPRVTFAQSLETRIRIGKKGCSLTVATSTISDRKRTLESMLEDHVHNSSGSANVINLNLGCSDHRLSTFNLVNSIWELNFFPVKRPRKSGLLTDEDLDGIYL